VRRGALAGPECPSRPIAGRRNLAITSGTRAKQKNEARGGSRVPPRPFRRELLQLKTRRSPAPRQSNQPESSLIYLRRLVGVSAPAVPPITAPAPAPRPRPMIAPAAAPPAAPTPTFLARRLPLLRFLVDLRWVVVVEAIRGAVVSANRPRAKSAAHSDFFIKLALTSRGAIRRPNIYGLNRRPAP
jgi:hypothetical protein